MVARVTCWRWHLVVITIAVAIGFCGCGGNIGSGALSAGPAADTGIFSSLTVEQAMTELDSMPTPSGTDPATFHQLKLALRSMLEESGTERWQSAAPDGAANAVNDLCSSFTQDGEEGIQWTYRNVGDYDLNSQVNIADITPIGIHFGKNTASPDWFESAQFADGDGNGEINISDITPIGQNFLNTVAGWRIVGADTEEGPFTVVESIPWDQGTHFQPSGLMLYNTAPVASYDYYRVIPLDVEGSAGTESLTSRGVILTDNTVVLGLEGGLQFVSRLEPNIIVLEAPTADPVDLAVGDILLGKERAGILFRVETVEQSGTEVRITGQPAELKDVLLQGAIGYYMDTGAVGTSGASRSTSSNPLFEFDLTGEEINTGVGVDLLIADGHLKFIPIIDIRISYNQYSGFEFFHGSISSALFELQLTEVVEAENFSGPFPGLGQEELSYKTLFSIPFTINETVNGMPIGAQFTYSATLSFTGYGNLSAMDGTYAASMDASYSNVVFGSELRGNEGWTDLAEFTQSYGNVGLPTFPVGYPATDRHGISADVALLFSMNLY